MSSVVLDVERPDRGPCVEVVVVVVVVCFFGAGLQSVCSWLVFEGSRAGSRSRSRSRCWRPAEALEALGDRERVPGRSGLEPT